jgi:hypothetical protein
MHTELHSQSGRTRTISLQWAGLPIEYWIDLNILESSSVSEILRDLCGMFHEQTREYHISLITKAAGRSHADK